MTWELVLVHHVPVDGSVSDCVLDFGVACLTWSDTYLNLRLVFEDLAFTLEDVVSQSA